MSKHKNDNLFCLFWRDNFASREGMESLVSVVAEHFCVVPIAAAVSL